MCWFGEAWAWGPYLNGPMGPDDAPRAHFAIRQALRVADAHGAADVERSMMEAMDGSVSARSEGLGRGTTMTLALPLENAPALQAV